MQVLPGVFQVNGSPYGRHQNGYLIHRDGTTVLIDSGDLAEDTFEEVRRNMARWGVRPEQVTHLLLTHAHFDHASHAARWQRIGVRIVASPETADAIAAGDERCIGYEVQRAFEPCQADEVLRDGETLRVGDHAVRAIAAPGHTAGLLIYEVALDGERLWFASDLLETQPGHRWVSLPWTGAPDFDRATYLRTLKALLALSPCDHWLPGHGPVAIGSGGRLLQMAYSEALVSWR